MSEQPGPERATQRLFVAVAVPRAVGRVVADAGEPLRARGAEARWTDPAGWHLTLAFLGGVAADRIEPIRGALAGEAGRHAPIRLVLTGEAGMFSRRVLFAEIAHSAELASLAGGVQRALEPLGFVFETRPFRAHLTLARARKGRSLPRDLAAGYDGPRLAWTVATLDLMRSHPGRGGARYERVGAWELAGGGGGI